MTGQPLGVAFVLVGYFVGGIPWGYIAGKAAGGIDLRAVGSGGTGATNVLRTLGKPASAIVLALDFLKGLLPVVAAQALGLDTPWIAATAVAAVVGHCWSPFIGFKGGKGMATGAGAAIALIPQALVLIPLMALVVWGTRYVSLGSLVVAIAAATGAAGLAFAGAVPWPYAVAVMSIAAVVIVRHRGNIERLLQGSERRIGERVAS